MGELKSIYKRIAKIVLLVNVLASNSLQKLFIGLSCDCCILAKYCVSVICSMVMFVLCCYNVYAALLAR